MKIPAKDRDVIRRLVAEYAEAASHPCNAEKKALWRSLNGLKPQRPMVMIDQICWNEFRHEKEFAWECEDPNGHGWEGWLRQTLYQWKHFPVDRVLEPFINVTMAVRDTGFAVQGRGETAVQDPTNSVAGHHFYNVFETDADLDKIKMPVISHDTEETERRLEAAHDLCDGILEVRLTGADPSYISFWDPISFWMSVDDALYAIVDRPDYIHEMLRRMQKGYMSKLDQLESMRLLCGEQQTVHCTGAYTDALPAPGYDPKAVRTKDIWCFGLAQMFSTVSPAMFDEFEVQYFSPIAARFGQVYYGCCDPLDLKMNEVRKIPNVRKVSMSPWVDQERGATEIGGNYVYSRKPSPALLATDAFDEKRVRDDLTLTRDICRAHGCPLEFILKDISTVRYEPRRLARWAEIATD
ncbi:MAG: hypothetical protein FWF84_05245, partial [Kiritimatiellaeota bacterium]|nr:hypothetical protein [Kiritimatiellota bacterium]